MLSLIVARDQSGAIGKDNTIPWCAPEDLAFFQRETMGGAVIMGRNTWDSLPFKPLKNRMNIVVTSRGTEAEHQVSSVDAAIALAQNAGYHRLYGIGGAGIYSALLPIADRLLVTEVAITVQGADTYFPMIDLGQWRVTAKTDLRPNAPACTVYEYMRHAS